MCKYTNDLKRYQLRSIGSDEENQQCELLIKTLKQTTNTICRNLLKEQVRKELNIKTIKII